MPDEIFPTAGDDPFTPDHLGVDLWRAERAWRDEMLRRLGEAGYGDITPADSDLLAFVGARGIRLADLARRRGVSKQAAQEKVRDLINRGYLTLGPDPDDLRAKRIAFAPKGLAMIGDLATIKAGMQAEMTNRLGAAGMAALQKALDLVGWPEGTGRGTSRGTGQDASG